MPEHSETRVLPYSAAQLYRLVVDVERYPEFLPWCIGARIREQSSQHMVADVIIGYKMIRERFTSKVRCEPEKRITVDYASGPFNHLYNSWEFAPHPQGCALKFHVAFDFRSRVLQELMGIIFTRAVTKMVAAFEARAAALYAPTKGPRAAARKKPAPARE